MAILQNWSIYFRPLIFLVSKCRRLIGDVVSSCTEPASPTGQISLSACPKNQLKKRKVHSPLRSKCAGLLPLETFLRVSAPQLVQHCHPFPATPSAHRLSLPISNMASTTGCATNGAPAGAPLTIGIVGFGNFGQFLGKEFVRQGHRVIGNSRRDYTKVANAIGCEYVTDAGVLMDAQPDVVVLCTSIMSLHSVMSKFPTERLAGVLVVDVLSVKMFARGLMREMLPADASILCTHPMFGPESGKDGWDGLPFVYDVVRVSEGLKPVCNAFLRIWEDAKCRMVPMSCEEHDQYAASTQFITHTTGWFRLCQCQGVLGTGRASQHIHAVV